MDPEVRSILKSPGNRSLTASAKKRLRFQDAELNDTFHSIESDEEYYTNMKREILNRSTPTKPKRKYLKNNNSLFRDIFAETDGDPPVLDLTKILNEHYSLNSKPISSNVGKMNNPKKYKVNRFNPISREDSCAVAMLKSRPHSETSLERMSWCST